MYKASVTTPSNEAVGPLKVLTAKFWFAMHGLSNFTINWERVPKPQACSAQTQTTACSHRPTSVPRGKFSSSSYSVTRQAWKANKNIPWVSWTPEGKDVGTCVCPRWEPGCGGCKEEPTVASACGEQGIGHCGCSPSTNLVMPKALSNLHHLFCL